MPRRSERNRSIVGGHSGAGRGIIAIGTIALILILLPIKSGGQAPQPLVVLNVCDVLANDPTILNGKLIRVRGFLWGTDEGIWLFGECKTHLETKGLVWGNQIAVTTDYLNKDSQRSWRKMGERMKQLHADWERDKIWVTFVGRLTTRATMDDAVVQMPYGLAKAGLGHLGAAPAEIEVLSAEEVTVERQPANKSRK